jgi:uncharacterized protein YebE (UPF0316 family)
LEINMGATIGTVILIFLLRIIDVSLGTIRTILIVRGKRGLAPLIGFIEVTIWIVAVSQVITSIDNVWKVLAYSGGFAAGTLVGMWLEERLALGDVAVYVVSREAGEEIAQKVRKADYGATELPAFGHSGPVSMVSVVTARKRLDELLRLVNSTDPLAFVTIDDKRQVMRGYRRLAK